MTLRYTRVTWRHQNSHDPVRIYSELDDARWEVRRVEVFSDDSLGYASRSRSRGRTFLSPETFSSLAEIAANPEFEAAEIEKDEFDEMWSKATRADIHPEEG
ncbi:hypothetical protein V5279_14635 [Bradyrhizobium sp. 26S5]|uniref:DUF6881 domain-containing protein n=1 Tax=Bradyrhizobium sp. 26S5 TaxID=3139729 RepID=UPI0030CC7845